MSENDSDEDSDYSPELEAKNESTEHAVGDLQAPSLYSSKKRKIDEIWEEMQLADKRDCELIMSRSTRPSYSVGKIKVSIKLKKLLSSIFGRTYGLNKRKTLKRSFEQSSDDQQDQANLKNIAQNSLQLLNKRQKVTETRKFAGQSITVIRTAADGVAGSNVIKTKPSSSTSVLDKILDDLKGPKVVSTITKSSYDWENFKEKEGLEDELAVAAKEGYLTKKEFLERCDVREYVKERDSRPKA